MLWLIILGYASLIALILFLYVRLTRFQGQMKLQKQKFEELNETVNKLNLDKLESKLNPHLFKNILNSIQSHAYQTYYAMDKLSNVLDYILYESNRQFVTPKEEIDFALNLVEINKIKLSPLFDLRIKTKIGPNEPLLTQKLLAPLICIDLIENAFKHADIQSSDSFIAVHIEFKESELSLIVSNRISTKPNFKKDKGGLGTETLEHRLNMIYGKNFKLDRFIEGDVYIAHLRINLLEHKAKLLDV